MPILKTFCPWITPKTLPDFNDPLPAVRGFFDHYHTWIENSQQTVIAFATGNGDHILNYRGQGGWDDTFDWARHSCHSASDAGRMNHNLDWLKRCREGGERSYNPALAGPSFILSEQKMNYRKLAGIYQAFREEATRRGVNLRVLEYLEPGPEFCECVWKTQRHPEAALGVVDSPNTAGALDVTAPLHAEAAAYAAYPNGIQAGTIVGDFVSGQTSAFTADMKLDGVFLGNQFGLIGFWHPDNAPPATPQRREGVRRFFHNMRKAMGSKLVYWMDTYWPADVEMEKWSMSLENYGQLDAVMVSNFSVITERTQVEPNVRSRLRVKEQLGGGPDTLFSVDFVDPWYWYRVYLDERKNYLFQHDMYRKVGKLCQGVSFFANDTFGHWVMPAPLAMTWEAICKAHA